MFTPGKQATPTPNDISSSAANTTISISSLDYNVVSTTNDVLDTASAVLNSASVPPETPLTFYDAQEGFIPTAMGSSDATLAARPSSASTPPESSLAFHDAQEGFTPTVTRFCEDALAVAMVLHNTHGPILDGAINLLTPGVSAVNINGESYYRFSREVAGLVHRIVRLQHSQTAAPSPKGMTELPLPHVEAMIQYIEQTLRQQMKVGIDYRFAPGERLEAGSTERTYRLHNRIDPSDYAAPPSIDRDYFLWVLAQLHLLREALQASFDAEDVNAAIKQVSASSDTSSSSQARPIPDDILNPAIHYLFIQAVNTGDTAMIKYLLTQNRHLAQMSKPVLTTIVNELTRQLQKQQQPENIPVYLDLLAQIIKEQPHYLLNQAEGILSHQLILRLIRHQAYAQAYQLIPALTTIESGLVLKSLVQRHPAIMQAWGSPNKPNAEVLIHSENDKINLKKYKRYEKNSAKDRHFIRKIIAESHPTITLMISHSGVDKDRKSFFNCICLLLSAGIEGFEFDTIRKCVKLAVMQAIYDLKPWRQDTQDNTEQVESLAYVMAIFAVVMVVAKVQNNVTGKEWLDAPIHVWSLVDVIDTLTKTYEQAKIEGMRAQNRSQPVECHRASAKVSDWVEQQLFDRGLIEQVSASQTRPHWIGHRLHNLLASQDAVAIEQFLESYVRNMFHTDEGWHDKKFRIYPDVLEKIMATTKTFIREGLAFIEEQSSATNAIVPTSSSVDVPVDQSPTGSGVSSSLTRTPAIQTGHCLPLMLEVIQQENNKVLYPFNLAYRPTALMAQVEQLQWGTTPKNDLVNKLTQIIIDAEALIAEGHSGRKKFEPLMIAIWGYAQLLQTEINPSYVFQFSPHALMLSSKFMMHLVKPLNTSEKRPARYVNSEKLLAQCVDHLNDAQLNTVLDRRSAKSVKTLLHTLIDILHNHWQWFSGLYKTMGRQIAGLTLYKTDVVVHHALMGKLIPYLPNLLGAQVLSQRELATWISRLVVWRHDALVQQMLPYLTDVNAKHDLLVNMAWKAWRLSKEYQRGKWGGDYSPYQRRQVFEQPLSIALQLLSDKEVKASARQLKAQLFQAYYEACPEWDDYAEFASIATLKQHLRLIKTLFPETKAWVDREYRHFQTYKLMLKGYAVLVGKYEEAYRQFQTEGLIIEGLAGPIDKYKNARGYFAFVKQRYEKMKLLFPLQRIPELPDTSGLRRKRRAPAKPNTVAVESSSSSVVTESMVPLEALTVSNAHIPSLYPILSSDTDTQTAISQQKPISLGTRQRQTETGSSTVPMVAARTAVTVVVSSQGDAPIEPAGRGVKLWHDPTDCIDEPSADYKAQARLLTATSSLAPLPVYQPSPLAVEPVQPPTSFNSTPVDLLGSPVFTGGSTFFESVPFKTVPRDVPTSSTLQKYASHPPTILTPEVAQSNVSAATTTLKTSPPKPVSLISEKESKILDFLLSKGPSTQTPGLEESTSFEQVSEPLIGVLYP